MSSLTGQPVAGDCVVFGEISLSGDVRLATQSEARLKEAAKLGFKTAIVPAGTKPEGMGLTLKPVGNVGELADLIGRPRAEPRRKMVQSAPGEANHG
jgi:DNA repair protein RadA/Sms